MWDEFTTKSLDREMIIMAETCMGPRCNRELAKACEHPLYRTWKIVNRLVRYRMIRVLYDPEDKWECSWYAHYDWQGPPQRDRKAFLCKRGLWDEYVDSGKYTQNPYRKWTYERVV